VREGASEVPVASAHLHLQWGLGLQGYLAHKKPPHPSTQQQVCVEGPMAVLGGGAISCERGTPVLAVPVHLHLGRGKGFRSSLSL
jgi:hypothetical protein